MTTERIDPLAVKVFEAYSRNSGNPPDRHFDRNAAVQWMTQALAEAGVSEMVAATASLLDNLEAWSDAPESGFPQHDFTRASRALAAFGRQG